MMDIKHLLRRYQYAITLFIYSFIILLFYDFV